MASVTKTNGKNDSDDEPKITLVYFDGRGRAEPIRYLFAAAGVGYEDVRVGVKEWDAVKPQTPLGQLPFIKLSNIKGELISTHVQSGAILRYYAAKYGLNGETPEQAFLADEIYESVRDLMNDAEKLMWYVPDPEKKNESIEALKNEKLPRYLGLFERKLKEKGGKFLTGGKKFTFCDFAVACLFDTFDKEEIVDLEFMRFDRPAFISRAELETNYPGLAALKKAVEESPGIKAYLANRPETTF